MLFIHGYHPLAEDGGIYAAGIFLRLDPSLFPRTADFVQAPMHYSMFGWTMATICRLTHVPPLWVLFIGYLSTTWLMLFAARQLLRRCNFADPAQFAGLALLAAWWTLPIAGTSLMLMDPYATARSFSTPLSLLAIGFALQIYASIQADGQRPTRAVVGCALCLAFAATMHPLMAAYAFGFVALIFIVGSRKPLLGVGVSAIFVLLAAFVLQSFAPAESQAWTVAAVSRYYWFLSQWHWYELAGLAGPIIVLSLLHKGLKTNNCTAARLLCTASISAGLIAFTVALVFAHESSPVHAVARLQPLRTFLPIYALMTILLGAAAFDYAAKQAGRVSGTALRLAVQGVPFACTLMFAFVTCYTQRQTYPASQHMELPWLQAANPWSQAHLWARNNTPKDALFALDAHYISAKSEDAQVFRAIALRDVLPDYSKDGGEAAITRPLAQQWQNGMIAQLNLNNISDDARKSQLAPFGVSWLVLQSTSSTQLTCPFDNGVAKVCRFSSKR